MRRLTCIAMLEFAKGKEESQSHFIDQASSIMSDFLRS